MHDKQCKHGCTFATKAVLLSRDKVGGNAVEDWLWKCSKLNRIVSADSHIVELGCATFTNEAQDRLVTQAESLIKEVDEKLQEITSLPAFVDAQLVALKPALKPEPLPELVPELVPEPVPATVGDIPIHDMSASVPIPPPKPKVQPKPKKGFQRASEISSQKPKPDLKKE